MSRGDVWWVDFGEPKGSAPAYRRPGVIVSSDRFNRSRLSTLVVATCTSNLRLAEAPGNVLLPSGESGLPKDSVVNVTQLLTIDRALLSDRLGRLPAGSRSAVDAGLRLVLAL